MYLTCCLRSLCALGDSPCADLLLACGEVGDKTEERIALLDDTVETRYLQTQLAEEHSLVLVAHVRDLSLYLRTDRQNSGVLLLCQLADSLVVLVSVYIVCEVILAEVSRIDDGLSGQQGS